MVAGNEILDENALLRRISDGTAAETGSDFFRAVVKNLSQVLGTHGAWITEYLSEAQQLRALAFWLAGDFVDHYVYDIAGTPCEASLKNKTFLHIPENVIELFPGDPDLAELGAVSYTGFPLLDPDDNILGNIAVVDTKPMPESYRNLALFRIFAARATAELLRLRAEDEIRNREEKLKGLFNGAMDTIVELDHDFNITMLNPAGEHIFGCKRDECLGKSFKQFLTSKDIDRLHQIIRKLDIRPRGERSVWVPDGLIVLNTDKRKIQTEATISQIEIDGTPCYVLILRDVNDRYEAQKMIDSLRDETEYLKDEIQSLYHLGEIIGESKPFRKTLQLVAEVAPTDSTVLIYGETGTGKELIARAIHGSSLRKDRPLITVNCAAIPETLMESEFFGYKKGAFTGAHADKSGYFDIADGGTLFLDEMGEISLNMQVKLLRVLESKEYTPVGANQVRRSDVRIIAATNRNLREQIDKGLMREDFFYRIHILPINLPPLRKRSEDIPLLVDYFINLFAKGKSTQPLSGKMHEALFKYSWPGNVRELQNVIYRYVTLNQFDIIVSSEMQDFKSDEASKALADKEFISFKKATENFEKNLLAKALETNRWHREKAAASL